MKKVLIVYLPFCTPASPPYSLTYLSSFLKGNSNHAIEVLDLNLTFHELKFPFYQKYFKENNWQDYDKIVSEYNQLTSKIYSKNNKNIRLGEIPELFEELLLKIKESNADVIAFSVVYSSQAFYAYSLLKEIKTSAVFAGVKTIIGGPAVNEILKSIPDETLNNEIEFLEFLEEKKLDHEKLNFNFSLDFSCYNLDGYFTPFSVIPLRTSNTCYYKQCTFCSHFSKVPYSESDLDFVKKSIIESRQNYFFLIDDMVPVKRLLQIATVLKPLNVKWGCQLKPTKDFTLEIFQQLNESGLDFVIWGVESGSQRVLDLMKKGTVKEDVALVLRNSHLVGIRNVTYIMFGFPSETKAEFLETIEFLETNKYYIDLVSTAIFGLQKGTYVYLHPDEFGITNIIESARTVLEPKISYDLSSGLNHEQAVKLRKSYKKTIQNINKYPNTMNFFREHMFF